MRCYSFADTSFETLRWILGHKGVNGKMREELFPPLLSFALLSAFVSWWQRNFHAKTQSEKFLRGKGRKRPLHCSFFPLYVTFCVYTQFNRASTLLSYALLIVFEPSWLRFWAAKAGRPEGARRVVFRHFFPLRSLLPSRLRGSF